MSDFVTLRPYLERQFKSDRIMLPFSRQAESAAHVKNVDRGKWISL
jgi:hypothetical protein